MSSGEATVQRWARQLRTMPGGEDLAKRMAPIMDADVKRTANAGTTPEGKAWKPRVDGSRALEGAADAIRTIASGPKVIMTVSGPEAIHNWGTSKDPKRQILPTALPSTLAGKLARAALAAVRKHLFGGRS